MCWETSDDRWIEVARLLLFQRCGGAPSFGTFYLKSLVLLVARVL